MYVLFIFILCNYLFLFCMYSVRVLIFLRVFWPYVLCMCLCFEFVMCFLSVRLRFVCFAVFAFFELCFAIFAVFVCVFTVFVFSPFSFCAFAFLRFWIQFYCVCVSICVPFSLIYLRMRFCVPF